MEAVEKRHEIDMLHGSIWRNLPRFALPVAATAVLSQLFNASDIAVVGNFTGELRNTAVAAVSTNSSVIGLFVNLFIGISLGAMWSSPILSGAANGRSCAVPHIRRWLLPYFSV